MKKSHFRVRQACALILCISIMSVSVVCEAQTTSQKIEDQTQKIDDLKGKQEEAEQQVDELEQQKTGLENKLSDLNTKLGSISNSIEDLANQMSEKETEIKETATAIEEAEADLEEAQNTAEKQYSDMKLRIQYMYENGSDSLFLSLLQADSIAEFLNRADYIKEISEYDRSMLTEYQKTTEEIAAKKQDLDTQKDGLESQRDELAALQEETKNKKSQVSSLINATQTDITNSDSALASAEDVAEALAAQLKQEQAYELQLEQQKANEDAARQAEIAAQEAANTGAAVVVDSDADATLLAALIYCEAGGESYEGQVAVGSVVMNRVRSSSYPGTVSGVIYQSGQFSPVASGRLTTVLANNLTTDSCRQAAATVLAGNLTNNFLYFRTNTIEFAFPVTVIGHHAFY